MDNMLCDELLQEIFKRLPSTPSSSLSVSLVSKRWLTLYRSSKASLSLKFSPHNSVVVSLSSLLSYYPSVSSLSLLVLSDSITKEPNSSTAFSDHLLFIVSSCCSNLHHLRFLPCPISVSSLSSLSKSCSQLTCITVSLSKPLLLCWVASFPCLKELCLYIFPNERVDDKVKRFRSFLNEEVDAEFGLETLCFSGIQADDKGVGWLWRNCKRLKKLQLKRCESVGDGESFSSFILSVKGLQQVELRKCRSIVDGVLLKLAENCVSLNSLLVYDGGSKDGLLEFINTCRSNLQKLDLRLPLDLNNNHLLAVAMNLRHISTLRLQSCCLVTGEGLSTLGSALQNSLEELALINCDVVEREIGLLATLGQNLRMLRKLNLSYNELLVDKELVSMLISCSNLTDLKLRGCRKITGVALVSIFKNSKCLLSVDIMNCPGIEAEAVEFFVLNCSHMRQMVVEESKVSDIARAWALHNFIEVTSV
ncbi:serine/threonine protein phosphatase 2A regulatory subunit B' [Hibiscus syriacus]|uniref:Serine/threonine protein phosphatase 2A regulatory subunit B n=1 Tax=Hibiscus syriacus TaxID=106335 RepID=A0A6A2ZIE7_HIBSY|nr:F-box/LRR-repeat protein 3-like [Hibiscus syriacus]XP_039014326.1 F-box/LRR-repeat protein 3-like [Hibiscus syriacus]XP_039014327.1 F-box/LRR-repeat protein 3-like [Hibiscus syriacus]KAE8691628.1 serine/threonine protein phosphatase 2A regulatory subunit B' [Hibiscus syriacus]